MKQCSDPSCIVQICWIKGNGDYVRFCNCMCFTRALGLQEEKRERGLRYGPGVHTLCIAAAHILNINSTVLIKFCVFTIFSF